MSGRELPFIGRSRELRIAKEFLDDAFRGGPSRSLLIVGDSGVGKTALCRRILRRLLHSYPDSLCLYLDLTADEMAATSVFQTLIALAWAPRTFTILHPVAIPEGEGFERHLRHRSVRRALGNRVLRTVAESARLLPTIGGAVAELVPALEEIAPSGLATDDLAVVFFSYLDRLRRRHPVVLALDNYQFLPRPLRILTECRMNALSNRCAFIPVVRTERDDDVRQNLQAFPKRQRVLHVRPFDRARLARLFEAGVPDASVPDRVLDDAFLKTGGNLKEIEYYLRSYLRVGSGDRAQSRIESLLDTVAKLPYLERSLLTLAALFPAGIDLPLVRRILGHLTTAEEPSRLQAAVQALVAIGYLVLNGADGQRLKPAHEKVITSVRESLGEEEFLTIRESAVAAFEDLLRTNVDWRDRPYLLHCLVGVMSFHELRQRLSAVCALVDHQHRTQNYHYLVALYESSPELLTALPDHIADMFLDAFQKTSQFYHGMEAVRALTGAGRSGDATLQLFLAKYLVQTYRFEQALEALAGLPDSADVLLCRMNALQCLSRDDEARQIISERLGSEPRTESWHVILRNSAHLFPKAEALGHLQRAFAHFERSGSEYGTASVLNNLGVVHLWDHDLESARRVLEHARASLLHLASAEVYQPTVNLGVLAALRGRPRAALRFLQEARRWVPATLTLDHIMIDENRLLIELGAAKIAPTAAIDGLRRLCQDARGLPDPRMQEEIAYNLHALERLFADEITVTPSAWFRRLVDARDRTGFECRYVARVGAVEVPTLLILSPHWRH